MILLKINITLLFFLFDSAGYSQTGYEIAKQMFARTKKIKTMTYTMKKVERINGLLTEQVSFTKLNRNPFKVYSKQIFPREGVEVLYVEGSNDNKALVNPNGFPWINLSLSPMGNTMRDKQHHTILESGYDHVISILEHLFDKYGEETKSMVRCNASIDWKGDSCWIVEINNPYFKYFNYNAEAGESIMTIARKNKLSEYMLLGKNKHIGSYNESLTGKIINMPNDYSPRMVLFIDKKRLIPLSMQIYDDAGLYELYEYSDIKIDSLLNENEFSKNYEEYGF